MLNGRPIGEILESAAQWLKKGSSARADVVLEVPPDLYTMAFESQLHQVAINMIQNAHDATEGVQHPLLRIVASQEGDRIAVTFTDNGSGIDEHDLLRVFDPFFTTKPVGKGTGLGLSISETIIRDHGGTISVSNAARGGAVFRIVLPAANNEGQ